MLIDDEDYDLVSKYIWYASPNTVGGFYASTKIKDTNSTLYSHRLIMGFPKGMVVDHINHDTLDNRKSNLRICTQSQNAFNRGLQRQNTSGYKGVHFYKRKDKYMAYIDVNRKRIHLGYFKTAQEAAKKYNEVALFLVGEYAHLNKLDV